jgi:hypothetical protein
VAKSALEDAEEKRLRTLLEAVYLLVDDSARDGA